MRRIFMCVLLQPVPRWLSAGLSWLGADAGLSLMLNAEEASAPSPLLLVLGLSMPIRQVDDSFYWEARYLFFTTHYGYADGKAFPVEVEAADSLWTLALDAESALGWRFDLGDKVRMGGGLCLAALFRCPLFAVGAGADFRADAFRCLMARFLYTGLEVCLDWRAQERMALVFSLRGLYPLFLAWEKGDVEYWDQLILGGTVSLRFALSRAAEEG